MTGRAAAVKLIPVPRALKGMFAACSNFSGAARAGLNVTAVPFEPASATAVTVTLPRVRTRTVVAPAIAFTESCALLAGLPTGPIDRRLNHQVDVVEDQRAVHGHDHRLISSVQLRPVNPLTPMTEVDAAVVQQIAGGFRPWMGRVKYLRGGGDRRFCFRKEDGRWKLTSWAVGD